MTVPEFAEAVVAYAQKMNASCTSWGRTSAHNAAVGGIAGSPHLAWLGVDLVYDGPPPPLAVAQATARGQGLTLIREADHDHIQSTDWVNRQPGASTPT